MSINHHPGKDPLTPPTARSWGSIRPDGRPNPSLRLVLVDRTISYPIGELKRWEHVAGNPETLTIVAGSESVIIEGHHLIEVRQALDESRLCELRESVQRDSFRDGPQIVRIIIESA